MNIFIVYAHPEPQSLNGSLKTVATETLTELGHTVKVSDLYAMQWKAQADGDDFLIRDNAKRLSYASESKRAFAEGTQSPEIAAEQEKLLWADAVILQFPLWWFSMPAILKGWIERVYAFGFAYGVGIQDGPRWGDRYGEGTLKGRRAMLALTAGGREPHYGARGVNGTLEDLLFPIQHGILFYPGMDVLPPFVIYQSDRLTSEQYEQAKRQYQKRLAGLFTDEPIPYRTQNGGDYDERQVLRQSLAEGLQGLAIHQGEK